MKCPACRSESPNGAAWCDFCKEPFKKKSAAAPPPSDAEVLPPAVAALIPKLMVPDEREKIPELPGWFRSAAWVFLGAAIAAGIIAAWFILTLKK